MYKKLIRKQLQISQSKIFYGQKMWRPYKLLCSGETDAVLLQHFWALFLWALEGLSKQRQFLCFFQVPSRQHNFKTAFLGFSSSSIGLTCHVFLFPCVFSQASGKFLFLCDCACQWICTSYTVTCCVKWKMVASPASVTQTSAYRTY